MEDCFCDKKDDEEGEEEEEDEEEGEEDGDERSGAPKRNGNSLP